VTVAWFSAMPPRSTTRPRTVPGGGAAFSGPEGCESGRDSASSAVAGDRSVKAGPTRKRDGREAADASSPDGERRR
jgi:hypothetical protein